MCGNEIHDCISGMNDNHFILLLSMLHTLWWSNRLSSLCFHWTQPIGSLTGPKKSTENFGSIGYFMVCSGFLRRFAYKRFNLTSGGFGRCLVRIGVIFTWMKVLVAMALATNPAHDQLLFSGSWTPMIPLVNILQKSTCVHVARTQSYMPHWVFYCIHAGASRWTIHA